MSDERLSSIGVFAPSTNVVDLLEEPSDSVGPVRRSSSLPPARVSFPDAVHLLPPPPPARPSCAPGTPARNLPGPSRVNAASSGVLVPLPGPSSVVRPSRASFVIPTLIPALLLRSSLVVPVTAFFFCFTENNPTMSLEEFCDALRHWAFVSYFCVGAEYGSGGTFHFQEYVELVRQLSFSTVKAALPRARLAKRRGIAEQVAVYCQKDGNFLGYGVRSSAGVCSDLHSVAASIIASDSMSSIATANPEVVLLVSLSVFCVPVLFIHKVCIRFHRGMWALRHYCS